MSSDRRFREVKGTQPVSGAAGTDAHSYGRSESFDGLSKSPRQPGRQWSLTKPRPQRPGVPGSSELLPAPPQPRGPLLHPGLPWTLCAVVTSREIDPEIGKQDAMSRYRAGGDKGWPGDGEGRGQEQGPR